MRDTFNNNLPHDSTIREWYARSDLNITPGINTNALKILKSKADEAEKNGKEFMVAISYDEMSIRQHVQWNNSTKKMLGFTTYGDKSIARQAIVFMISDLNSSFRTPVAYHFIKGLKAPERKELLQQLLVAIGNIGSVYARTHLRSMATMQTKKCVICLEPI